MNKALVPVRDLTDCDQNQAVLDVASALAGGRASAERVADSHGPAVAAEAMAAARSRRRLGELTGPIGGDISISPAFDRLTSAGQSRKGGSVLAGLAAAVRADPRRANGVGRHVVCYTDADLSANLAQLGSLGAPARRPTCSP